MEALFPYLLGFLGFLSSMIERISAVIWKKELLFSSVCLSLSFYHTDSQPFTTTQYLRGMQMAF